MSRPVSSSHPVSYSDWWSKSALSNVDCQVFAVFSSRISSWQLWMSLMLLGKTLSQSVHHMPKCMTAMQVLPINCRCHLLKCPSGIKSYQTSASHHDFFVPSLTFQIPSPVIPPCRVQPSALRCSVPPGSLPPENAPPENGFSMVFADPS